MLLQLLLFLLDPSGAPMGRDAVECRDWADSERDSLRTMGDPNGIYSIEVEEIMEVSVEEKVEGRRSDKVGDERQKQV